jgi:cholesterol oxidase
MQMLSRPVDQIQGHYSAVVVGSGYGGAIAAARIARAGRDVCVLERGKELHPGEYPNTALSTSPWVPTSPSCRAAGLAAPR